MRVAWNMRPEKGARALADRFGVQDLLSEQMCWAPCSVMVVLVVSW